MNHSVRYRPEIDGLRTLAVVPVVLFHAGMPHFGGGYVGVDIFFVISGYLITGIIYREMEEQRFSIIRFYERRIRRIFPALIAMMTCVAVLACLVDLPSELRDLPRNIGGALLFSSNIVMWRHSGYFDAPAETNPLLHTWSLGVEEQFYIGAPIFLFLLMRYCPRSVKSALVLAAVASLALCVAVTPIKPDAAFYLVPTRAWELLAGALLAIGCVRVPNGRGIREALAWGGLAMLAASVVLFTPKISFPGYAAVLPVLGGALIVGAAGGTSLARLLGAAPMVAVGRISYSLYLWHWPMIVFGRQLGLIDDGWLSIVAVCVLSLAVAWASWRFIEQPFRGNRIGASRIFTLAAASAGIILVGTIDLRASDGWPGRLSQRVVALDAASGDVSPERNACHRDHGLPSVAASCVFGGKTASVAFWGDSHGVELSYALGTEYRPVMSITYSSCPPALGYSTASRPDCTRHNSQVFDYLRAHRAIGTVVMTAYYVGIAGTSFDGELSKTVRRLRAAGKKVVVIGPFPSPGIDVPKALAHGHSPVFPRRDYEQHFAKTIALLHRIERDGAEVVWPAQFDCDRTNCHLSKNGHPLFFDRHHPSMTGARLFVKSLLERPQDRQLLARANDS